MNSSQNEQQNNSDDDSVAYYRPIAAEDIAVEGNITYAASRILITAQADATFDVIENLVKEYKGEIVGYISFTNDYEILFDNRKNYNELEDVLKDIQSSSLVESASLSYLTEFTSNAVDYSADLWKDDSNLSDTSGADWDQDNPDGLNWWAEAVSLPSVWDSDIHFEPVKVGIIDTNFDIDHKDLKEKFKKVWSNPEDSDGNCTVAQLYEQALQDWSQAHQSGDSEKEGIFNDAANTYSHGTHVAGLIAAIGGNGEGITGTSQNAELYAFAKNGTDIVYSKYSSVFFLKCALAHLLNEGVRIINLSIGCGDIKIAQNGDPDFSSFLDINSQSMAVFLSKYIDAGYDFLICKAAGNDSDNSIKYDVKYDLFGAIEDETVKQHIIIVGATKPGKYNIVWENSNQGERVDFWAPGQDILSTKPSNKCGIMSGTSMSTPIVAGIAALVWGANPELSSSQVCDCLYISTMKHAFDYDSYAWSVNNNRREWNSEHMDTELPVNAELEAYSNRREWISEHMDIKLPVNAELAVNAAMNTKGTASTSGVNYKVGTIAGFLYAVNDDGKLVFQTDVSELILMNKERDKIQDVPITDVLTIEENDSNGVQETRAMHAYDIMVEPGDYLMRAKIEGYDPIEIEISVSEGDVLVNDFVFGTIGVDIVLNRYRKACSYTMGEWSAVMDEFSDINTYAVSQMHAGNASLFYQNYDIDHDGTEELIISMHGLSSPLGLDFEEYEICDVFAFDGSKPVRLFEDDGNMGELYTIAGLYDGFNVYLMKNNGLFFGGMGDGWGYKLSGYTLTPMSDDEFDGEYLYLSENDWIPVIDDSMQRAQPEDLSEKALIDFVKKPSNYESSGYTATGYTFVTLDDYSDYVGVTGLRLVIEYKYNGNAYDSNTKAYRIFAYFPEDRGVFEDCDGMIDAASDEYSFAYYSEERHALAVCKCLDTYSCEYQYYSSSAQDYSLPYFRIWDDSDNDLYYSEESDTKSISAEEYWDYLDELTPLVFTSIEQKKETNVSNGDVYSDFLNDGKYQSYTSDWYFGGPERYALLDINADGTDELLIASDGDDSGVSDFVVFSYNTRSNSVELLPVNGRDSGTFYDIYYQPKYDSLVYLEARPSRYEYWYCFDIVDGNRIKTSFEVGYEFAYEEGDVYYVDKPDDRKLLSKSEFDSYFEDKVELNWKRLP